MKLIKDTPLTLSKTTISLHWIVAVLIIGLLGSGLYMENFEAFFLMSWHKSFGVLLFAFALLRVTWRIINGWPKHTNTHPEYEMILAKVIHYVLIISMLLMPISGLITSGMGGHGVDLFGLEIIPHNPNPENPQRSMPFSESWSNLGKTVHGLTANALLVALGLHIVGAIKHHVIDKDNTLTRMLGKK
ncbi:MULTISPECIES: cytochrome b [Pseudoalteromonas]|uniref:cytochrome b n=1 Tax=Pseudoalteromonas TaxID=53246 RepID=UPI0026E180E6|nr:cytochrome b [Pseudoalteromonas carrageenovora]MDO6463460.1 cytochrome b [Pseudoalteromonas carrageenovora]